MVVQNSRRKEWKDKSSISYIDMTVDAAKQPAWKLLLSKIAVPKTHKNPIQEFKWSFDILFESCPIVVARMHLVARMHPFGGFRTRWLAAASFTTFGRRLEYFRSRVSGACLIRMAQWRPVTSNPATLEAPENNFKFGVLLTMETTAVAKLSCLTYKLS